MFQFCDNLPWKLCASTAGFAMLLFCVLGAAPTANFESNTGRAAIERRAAALTALGRLMFADRSLSASGKLSCASCHSPRDAFGPPNALPVQAGGADMRRSGVRAVPSLEYLQAVPPFTEHFFDNDDEGDESVDNGPTGGLTWDGRVDRDRDQAKIPLLSPDEMANASPAALVVRLRNAVYANEFRRLFGAAIFADPDQALADALEAFEVYQQSYREFYPYSSKYDAYLAGKAKLSPAERRGLSLFENPAKGNCARCHISQRANDGTPPQFTDYGLVALGVPRNPVIPANNDPGYFDLGLCGPLRTDLSDNPEYCGRFMTPTLRNAASRRVFFHNGAVPSLRAAVAFYAERDTAPEKWYPRGTGGEIRKFDDLPPQYQTNVETDPPFGGHAGDRPPLSEREIDDIVAFLRTLNDGYRAPDRPR
jgi:cytochrome c peroxidase